MILGDRIMILGDRIMILADRIMILGDRIMIPADRIMIPADRVMILADPHNDSSRPYNDSAPPVPMLAGPVANPAGNRSVARGFARPLTQRWSVPPGSVGVSSVGVSSAGAPSGTNRGGRKGLCSRPRLGGRRLPSTAARRVYLKRRRCWASRCNCVRCWTIYTAKTRLSCTAT